MDPFPTETLSSQPSSIVKRPEMFTDDSCIYINIEFDRTKSSQKECGFSFDQKMTQQDSMDIEQ